MNNDALCLISGAENGGSQKHSAMILSKYSLREIHEFQVSILSTCTQP